MDNVKYLVKKIAPSFIMTLYKSMRESSKKKKYNSIQDSYELILSQIKSEVKSTGTIRVGFYIIFDSSWGSRPLFERMLTNDFFDPKIVVCPDVARGLAHEKEVLSEVYSNCCNKYGKKNVICSYDIDSSSFKDCSDQFDIIFIANPYDEMTEKFYSVDYLGRIKKKLTAFCDYGYSGKLRYDLSLYKSNTYNLFWKEFVDNENTRLLQKETQYIGDKNVVVSGSCKMDKLAEVDCNVESDYKKKIIIAPHHTVRKTENGLNLSNFLRFADFFLKIPKKYPSIQFIFRPHPLLFTTLRCDDLWGDRKVEEYLFEMKKNKNVIYSTEGEYFDIFAESDAMIDDCGSFLAEYFYTDKPQCYMIQSEEQFDHEYLDFGKKFFNYVYKAKSEKDICNFIDNVVIGGIDSLKDERQRFAQQEVMLNYPHVADFIISYLKNQFFE